MQARRASAHQKLNLRQGHIFKISELILPIKKKVKTVSRSIEKVYPEIDFSNISHAIILTQSCDLANDRVLEAKGKKIDKGRNPEKYKYRRPKVPHITLGLLEPIDKFVERFSAFNEKDYKLQLQEYIQGLSNEFNIDIVSPEKALFKFEEDLKKLFQNNHPWAFFISIPPKNRKLYYYVNLTKLLPLKIEHYEKILDRVEYVLNDEFSNKLGWKLAELFGRVGTQDYNHNDIEDISKNVLQIVENSVFKGAKETISLSSKEFNELKKKLSKAKSKEDPVEFAAKVLREAIDKNPS